MKSSQELRTHLGWQTTDKATDSLLRSSLLRVTKQLPQLLLSMCIAFGLLLLHAQYVLCSFVASAVLLRLLSLLLCVPDFSQPLCTHTMLILFFASAFFSLFRCLPSSSSPYSLLPFSSFSLSLFRLSQLPPHVLLMPLFAQSATHVWTTFGGHIPARTVDACLTRRRIVAATLLSADATLQMDAELVSWKYRQNVGSLVPLVCIRVVSIAQLRHSVIGQSRTGR